MSPNTDGHLSRRRFLKAASYTAGAGALGSTALARRLVLIDASGVEQISKIEWVPYDTGLRGPDERSIERCAVRITTTAGAQGWADVSIWAAPDHETALAISDTLRGQSPASHPNLWRQFYEQGLALGTLGAIDVALWDLRARIAGQPVHALLGTQREMVKTYLSTGFNLGEPALYAQYAGQAKDKGIGGIKIQPYIEWDTGTDGPSDTGFPDKDMAVHNAVREAVGADYPCMVDNHGVYTYDQALRVGRLLDDLDYAWYQSPMPETEEWINRYVALAKALRTPLCAPETYPGAYESRIVWIDRKACDIARISVQLGGFTACLQLALACQSAGVRLELHNVGPDAYPHLQLMGATSESLIRHLELLSLPRDNHVLPGRATPEPAIDANGQILIPQTPGMGVELDWTYIFAHKIR